MTNIRWTTPPTVLVVDDSPDLVEVLSLFLTRQGMTVLCAYDGRECLEKVREHVVDVIILDVMMPGMNGLEVCAALQGMPSSRSVPIVLLTAKDDIKTRLTGVELGVSEFVVKPVRGKDLLARIQTQIEVSRSLRALDDALSPTQPLQIQA